MNRLLFASILAAILFASDSGVLADDAAAYLYNKECAGCHGKDGKGKTPTGRKVGAKDLTLSKSPDAEMEKQLIEGKKAPNGTPAMPPFKDKLDSEEIKDLILFVKKFRK